MAKAEKKKGFFSSLLFKVTVGIVIGLIIGFAWPSFATQLRPLGIGFIPDELLPD